VEQEVEEDEGGAVAPNPDVPTPLNVEEESSVRGPNPVETMAFHRNHIETMCLSLASQSSRCWRAISMLLDPDGECQLRTISVSEILRDGELHTSIPRSSPTPQMLSKASRPASNVSTSSLSVSKPYDGMPGAISFWQLAERVRLDFKSALLLGWRRTEGKREIVLNPHEKSLPLLWCAKDKLIILEPNARASRQSQQL